jgi:uncharacterized membrane protein
VLNTSPVRSDRDDGSILLLVIGYTAIAAVLIAVGVDASKVFLARRALSAAADSAALAAAQGIDTRAVYDGSGIRCGARLPLSRDHAAALAAATARAAAPGLLRTFAFLDAPQTSVARGTVTVVLGGEVAVPFARVLTWLDPRHPSGRVGITETSHAESPVVGVGGC